MNESVTITKAIGIMLMVVAHAGMPFTHDFIYMFHMPLFFIVSGYCFKQNYLDNPKKFVTRKIKGLYFPFVKYGVIFVCLHNVFCSLNVFNVEYSNANMSLPYTLEQFVHRIFFDILLFNYAGELIGGFWFLIQLFWASIFSFLILKTTHRPLWGVLISLMASLVLVKYNIRVPYTQIQSMTFMAVAFFLVGYLLKQREFVPSKHIAMVCFIVVLIGSFLFPTEMPNYNLRQSLPYFVCAIAGTLMVLYISGLLARTSSVLKSFIMFVGSNTLTILTWHFLCFRLISLLVILIEDRPIEELAQSPVLIASSSLLWIPYSVAGLIVPLGISYVYIRLNASLISRSSYISDSSEDGRANK